MIQLTFTFDSVAAAAEFLDSQGARAPQEVVYSLTEKGKAEADAIIAGKKPRKPRADAGVPRGPYKTNGGQESEPAAATGGAEAPAAPTNSAADKPHVTGNSSGDGAAAEPTLDDVKAAMSVLSKKKNIDANIQLLAKFGAQKASALPKEKYAEFIAAAKKEAGVS